MRTVDTGAGLVVEFLRAKRPDLDEIDPELDLIESRILDSLHFVEFLYLLEEATGQQIPLEEVSAENFRTLSAIRARFFDGAG
jgi:acyl carrier protein